MAPRAVCNAGTNIETAVKNMRFIYELWGQSVKFYNPGPISYGTADMLLGHQHAKTRGYRPPRIKRFYADIFIH